NAAAYIGLCCAHCGGNMPLNIMGGGIPETHEYRFKISEMFMRMEGLRDGTDEKKPADYGPATSAGKFRGVPKSMTSWMTMVGGAYSFTDNFAGMIMGGYVRNTMSMDTTAGGYDMFSQGLTDTKLIGKYRLYSDDNLAPKHQLSAITGVTAPTGRITLKNTNHPTKTMRGKLLPFGMQTGSGTWDPIFGLTYQKIADPFWYGANFMTTQRWGTNDQDYTKGDEYTVDLYLMKQFNEKALAHVQLNGKAWGDYSNEPKRGKDSGDCHAMLNPARDWMTPLCDPTNYGGVNLHATIGVQFQPVPLHIAELNLSVPLYQNLKGPQLQSDYMLRLTYYLEVPTKKSRRYKGFSAPKQLGF
ncbi:MAG: transporter, partial [Nitrospina sp.]|nr:transporter [Nitrospina sp.]